MVCESYAERSRSEQMKCLQIWRTGIYTWNLSAGWLHLNIYNATKVVSWGKKEKQPRGETLLWKQVSNENRKQSQVPLCVLQREPSTEIDWTTQSSASHLVVPRSIMRQRISRLERVFGLILCHLGLECSGSYLGKFRMPLGMEFKRERVIPELQK